MRWERINNSINWLYLQHHDSEEGIIETEEVEL
jgi:hypothetical protein